MPCQEVKELLDRHQVKYEVIHHARTYTAQEAAAAAGVSGKAVAKTVVIKVAGRMAMAVLPASAQIDLDLLAGQLHVTDVQLAEEHEFEHLFPGCELGAMPPFGNLYDMPVYVEELLMHDKDIVFHCGSLDEMIRVAFADYRYIVQPVIRVFAYCPWVHRRAA